MKTITLMFALVVTGLALVGCDQQSTSSNPPASTNAPAATNSMPPMTNGAASTNQ